ncbi:MAG: DUF2911 domain-containing protein [Acidobacteria bacterium]|nr:DUF2911 domain-containing protein [Acidobacteriota bacterium]
MQIIGTTEVTMSYGRPSVRERVIFGEWPEKIEGEQTLDDGRVRPPGAPVVAFGHLWRTGADEATLFTANDDVLINGELLPAGRYSFHTIPGKEEWTLIFNKDEGQWGSFSYDRSKDQLRVKVKPEWQTESKEFLYFRFATVKDDTATAYLRWEKVKVPFTVKVKDVVGSTIKRLKTYAETAGAGDAGPWMTAAGYARNNKQPEQAKAWFEKAWELNEASIARGTTYQNLSRKGNILLGLDRRAEAITALEAALAKGKEEKIRANDLEALEKRIADLKAAK